MKFSQGIKMALSAILSNKMRSFLTMLGVIIGVAAVIALIGLGEGATGQVSDQIESLGTNLITVNLTGGRNRSLEEDDIEKLKEKPYIESIAPYFSGSAIVKVGNKNMNTSLEATSPEYEDITNSHVQAGRFLVDNDLKLRFRVAVIGVEVADELFGHRNVVGESISINGTPFKIVGLLEEKGSSMMGSADNRIIIPLTTAQRLLRNTSIRSFYISADSPETVDLAVDELEAYLMKKFKDENSFRIISQSQLLSTVNEIAGTLTMMLGGIAGISLVVGGIGIMNIMLVSVTERIREIGIRKAIGARRRDILFQFLIESMVISGLGGVIGILLGITGSNLIGRALNLPVAISPRVIALATGFSVTVGIIFGLYPANKASKLNPIDALAYE